MSQQKYCEICGKTEYEHEGHSFVAQEQPIEGKKYKSHTCNEKCNEFDGHMVEVCDSVAPLETECEHPYQGEVFVNGKKVCQDCYPPLETEGKTWEEEFEEMEKNHGWIPEHKERIKDFIRQTLDSLLAEKILEVEKLQCTDAERIEAGMDIYNKALDDALQVLKK